MAKIVNLRNKKTGKVEPMYSADARDVLNNPKTKDEWEFVSEAERGTKLADPKIREIEGGPATIGPESQQSATEKSLQGVRGGRPQEPAQPGATGGAPTVQTPADAPPQGPQSTDRQPVTDLPPKEGVEPKPPAKEETKDGGKAKK